MSITPEMLAAYADGQLGTDDRAKVDAAIAVDPSLAGEVAAHQALRDQLRTHFAPILDSPVPDRLTALLQPSHGQSAEIMDMLAARAEKAERQRSATRIMPRWIAAGAIAASLAIGLVIGGQFGSDGSVRSVGGQLVASGALDTALTTQLSSTPNDQQAARILLSFRDESDRYCRAYTSGAASGIACRSNGHWALVRIQANGRTQGGEYRQAGSVNGDIMTVAQEMAAGGALDSTAEHTAIRSGWED